MSNDITKPEEIIKIKQSLTNAYALIRKHQELISDLVILISPLVRCVERDPVLAASYRECVSEMQDELIRSKIDSLALIDELIRQATSCAT
jgi:hypothetical protein